MPDRSLRKLRETAHHHVNTKKHPAAAEPGHPRLVSLDAYRGLIMIQPSFMFMVGVSVACSYAKRTALGRSWRQNLGHAGKRALILIPLVMYCLGQLLHPWMRKTLKTHLGGNVFGWLGENWQPFLQANLVGLVFWMICWWLYRQRIFVRI